MKARMLTLIAIFGLGMAAVALHSGGGDVEHGFYWWNDNTVHELWDIPTSTYPSYLNFPEEIPWFVQPVRGGDYGMQGRGTIVSGYSSNNIYMCYPYNSNGIPFPFMFWWELRGYGDTTSSEAPRNYYVGVIVNQDGYIKKNIPLKFGGKYPPELNDDALWHNIKGDAWFWFYGKVYKEIAISTDGWAAFNPGTIQYNPHGNLPDPQLPNATIAPYWFDLRSEQRGYGAQWWLGPMEPNPANWDPTSYPDTNYVHPDSGAVLYGFRWYMIDAYSDALDAADTAWPAIPHTNIGRPNPNNGHVYVPVPVFIMEWCDMQKAASPDQHYTFETQLINPVMDDTNWAKFVGRLGRPGIRKEVAEQEVAHMWFYQFKTLIPQQVICLYYGRYNEASGDRPGDVADWPDNHDGYDLVGIENEDGSKGLTAGYTQLEDLSYYLRQDELKANGPYPYVWFHEDWRGKVKFDYFKRCYEDLGITIVEPPFNIVLRYTHLRPVVLVANYGRNSATEAPIDILVADTAGTQIYYDSRTVNLYGLGTDRWRLPNKADETADTFRFAKKWKPGEIGTQYVMRAEIQWGLDVCEPGNNIHEKDVYVHCDDTLAWHDGEENICDWAWYGWNWISGTRTYTVNQDYETFIPWGGSQIKFSWIKGFGVWIAENFPDDAYNRFEMTMVRDDTVFGMGAGLFEAGWPATDHPANSRLMYPPLRTEDSWDEDGWFDENDISHNSEGPPGRTMIGNANYMGAVKFNDTLYLGDSLANKCWPGGKGDADGWIVYWTGQYESEWQANMGPFLIDGICFDTDGQRISPYWDLTGAGNDELFREFDDYDWLPDVGIDDADFFYSLPYLLSEYPEFQPFHPMIEAYIHTGTYDAALYQIVSPEQCIAGEVPGYYLEDHIAINFHADIANLGRDVLTDDNTHRFRVFAVLRDTADNVACSTEVGITKLKVGAYMTAKPPKWDNSGDGSLEYELLMCVRYEHPGMHHADHCPYNDSMTIPLWVLWTYDIECTDILSPVNGETIPAGDVMHITARFTNLGINDTINIPVTCKVYNAEGETPTDSMLYMSNFTIPDLNWRCSPAGVPNSVVVDFGDYEVPTSTLANPFPGDGRYMRIECRLVEIWMDEDPMNDFKTIYVNGEVIEGIADKPPVNLPKVFKLSSVLPNPATSSVAIKYDVPVESKISLKVYDVTGKLVKTLIDGRTEAGYNGVAWNGLDNTGKRVSRGIYFVKMDAPKYEATKKLVIVH